MAMPQQRKKPGRQPEKQPEGKRQKFLLVKELEEPTVAFLAPVRVELLGNRQAVVDGCRGIIEYSDSCIRLSAQGLILKFTGTGTGEGQTLEGGDIIFAHKFQNFIFEFEWKISKGGNSGTGRRNSSS